MGKPHPSILETLLASDSSVPPGSRKKIRSPLGGLGGGSPLWGCAALSQIHGSEHLDWNSLFQSSPECSGHTQKNLAPGNGK